MFARPRFATRKGTASPTSLRQQVRAEYPELPANVVSAAVDRAYVTALALGFRSRGSPELVATALARDRLDRRREQAGRPVR